MLCGVAFPRRSRRRQDASRARPPRIYNTQRLAGQPPSIDGRLDDEAWKEGEWAGDYIQQLPVEGGVAVAEDRAEDPLRRQERLLRDPRLRRHVARSRSTPPGVTRSPATSSACASTATSTSDRASSSTSTRPGTKIDLVLTNEGWDTTWDAVWDGKVAYEADAWTAEFRIPLSQLRYGPQDVQVWGMHSWRWIDRLQEESQWNLIPRAGHGAPVQLRRAARHPGPEAAPPRRAAAVRARPGRVAARRGRATRTSGDADGKAAVGLDAKIGLTSNFTLDATVNPDFGQVEADPSVVNLTTYETFYEEKRPFFLEGKRIFTLGLPGSAIAGDESGTLQGDQMFYSRRIGAPPSVRPAVDDGRVPRDARRDLDHQRREGDRARPTTACRSASCRASPTTSTRTCRSTASSAACRWRRRRTTSSAACRRTGTRATRCSGGMFTSTHRWLPDDGALQRLPTDAFTGAVDCAHFFANRSYVVEGKGFFSRITGDALAIRALQTNPVHYYQRPDADHLGVDAGATSLAGHGGTVARRALRQQQVAVVRVGALDVSRPRPERRRLPAAGRRHPQRGPARVQRDRAARRVPHRTGSACRATTRGTSAG